MVIFKFAKCSFTRGYHKQAVGTTMRPMMRTFFTLPHQTRRLSCSASRRKELADSLSTWLRLTSTAV